MYSTKEKLSHFRSLLAPDLADADLQLLKERNFDNSNLVRFSLAPTKNAEDILFALLDVCTHDEIVRNRRDFVKPTAFNKPKSMKKAIGSKKGAGKKKTSKKTPGIQGESTVSSPAEAQFTSEQSQKPATDSTSEGSSDQKKSE